MKFKELADLIFKELKPKLEDHNGLAVFARERSKFEGWLKVELCDSLFRRFKDVCPEKERVDVSFDKWGIELKTVNTNLRYKGVVYKTRPITKNTSGVIEDIEKLQKLKFNNKAVLFLVFPAEHEDKYWQIQLQRIRKHLSDVKHCSFNFKGGIPGIIYFGLI
jgi:hypothetical protein